MSHDPYDAWIHSVPIDALHRGGRELRTIDDAPDGMDELRSYFVTLPEASLAASWVACVTENARREFTTGDLARALLVVAVRLHEVTLPEKECLIMPEVLKASPMRPIAMPVRGPAAPPPAARAPTVAGEGWAVETDGPIPIRKGKGKQIDPGLFAALCSLSPLPARIRLDAKKFGKARTAKIIAQVKDAGGPALDHFVSADGHRIVHALRAGEVPQLATDPGPKRTPAAAAPSSNGTGGQGVAPMPLDQALRKLDASCAVGKKILLLDVFGELNGPWATAMARDSGRYRVERTHTQGRAGFVMIAERVE